MKIIRLRTENFKKIVLVDITPDGNVIKLTGPNGSGKTSVLDSFVVAMAWKHNQCPKPVREGEKEASVHIDLGDYVVDRVFTDTDKQPPVVVRAKSNGVVGKSIRSPQDLLDRLLGDLTFDPLAFARMKPAEQYEELRRIVKLGPELDEFDKLNEKAYAERTGLNRMAKDAEAEARSIDVSDDLPAERVNVAQLAEEMEAAGKHNTDIEKRKIGRAAHEEKIKSLNDKAAEMRERLPAALTEVWNRRDATVKELEERIARVRNDAMNEAERVRAQFEKGIDQCVSESLVISGKLAGAPPIPEPRDVFGIKESIANANYVNAGIDARERREQKEREAGTWKRKAQELTEEMEKRTKQKMDMIAAAKMPIPGLSLENGVVTFHGMPFEQASSAEQLRVSVAVAMAANPTLRVLRIKDGSLLDSKSWQLLAEMCKENDFQVWVEVVDESGQIGIVMEDGKVSAVNLDAGQEEFCIPPNRSAPVEF